jgi:antitoxin component YwqK of YwqJK toxin-antitoxin module
MSGTESLNFRRIKMKNLLKSLHFIALPFLFLFLISDSSHAQVVDISDISFVDSLFCLKDGSQYSGKIINHFDTGVICEEINVKDGKQHGKHLRWFKNGKLEQEYNFANGKENGKQLVWYEDGTKHVEGFSIDGKHEGPLRGWFPNGNIQSEFNYKNGKKHGKYIIWDEKGNKLFEEIYEEGKLIK